MTTKGIYVISNTIDDRVYVGKFSRTPYEIRKRLHINTLKRGCHHSRKLQNFYNKYGIDSLRFSVIFNSQTITDDELNTLEGQKIQEYNSYKKGFNMSLGGEGAVGVIRTKEQRDKIASKLKDIYQDRSVEYRQAVSDANVNKKRVIMNDKIYESALQAAVENGVNYNTMIRWLREERNGFKYEVKENSEINKPAKIEVDGVIYDSVAEAARSVGYSRSTIRARIKDDRFPNYKYIERNDTYKNSGRKSSV